MAYYQSSLDFSSEGEGGPDTVYYNADIINGRTSGHPNTYDPVVRFQETRDMPIVKDASLYNFSIVRFTMDGAGRDLPAFIPRILENQVAPGNVNLTVYKFFISVKLTNGPLTGQTFTSTDAASTVIYEPETQNAFFAPSPNPATIEVGGDGQAVNTRYYWVYTISHWLYLVNKTIATAWENVNTQITTAGGAALVTRPPYMTLNPSNNFFSLYADSWGFGGEQRQSAGAVGPIIDEEAYLYMNSNSFGMFANFDNVFFNTVVAPELNNQVVVKNILGSTGNFVPAPTAASGPLPTIVSYTPTTIQLTPTGAPAGGKAGWFVMTQDAPSSDCLWSPVASIVFCSTMLPLVNESSGDPVYYGDSTFNDIQTVQRAFQPIVTDISIAPDNAMSWKGFISYTPQAEYRLASFQKSKTAINNIDIQVFWKNRLDGQLYPLEMFNLSSVSIKCMFRKRSVMTK
jgi:hypothetical protein